MTENYYNKGDLRSVGQVSGSALIVPEICLACRHCLSCSDLFAISFDSKPPEMALVDICSRFCEKN